MDNEDKHRNRKEKEEFSIRKLQEMRKHNAQILERHATVENDRIAAENNNASITNFKRRSERSRVASYQQERLRADKISRHPDQSKCDNLKEISTYTREWDRGKVVDGDWISHSHRGFKDYKTSNWNEKKYRRDTSLDKSSKNHFPHNFYKQKKSNNKPETFHENFEKSYFSYSKKYSTHDSSSSSTEDEYTYNKNSKVRKPNRETLWRSDRINDDKNKLKRTVSWVKSQRNLEQDNISAYENAKNTSPKRKYYEEFETKSEKDVNEKYLPPKNKKQSNLKSNKHENKRNTLERRKIAESKTYGHYSKFERFDHSDESSSESSRENCRENHTKKVDYNMEARNFGSEKRAESEEPASSTSKSSHHIEPHFIKNIPASLGCNPIKKVSAQNLGSSFNDKSYNIPQKKCDKPKCSRWKISRNIQKCDSSDQNAGSVHNDKKSEDGPANECSWNNKMKEDLKVPDKSSMKLKGNKEDDKKKVEKNKVNYQSLSDDGGWSTVEEDEIRSKDSEDHNK